MADEVDGGDDGGDDTGWLDDIANIGGDSNNTNWSGIFSNIGNLVSGINGLNQSSYLQGIINNAYSFNAQRPGYANNLNEMMTNPSGFTQGSSEYKAGMGAAQGQVAAADKNGVGSQASSGAAMADVGGNYSQTVYNNMFKQYSQMSGAEFDPANFFKEEQQVQQSRQNSNGSEWGAVAGAIGTVAEIVMAL